MKQYPFLLAIIFLFTAQIAMAHGGHKKEPAPIAVTEEPADSMYVTEEKESDPLGGSDLFSPSDLFMQGEIAPADPVEKTDMKMEGSHKENDDHNMPKVESAKHKAVEASSKGYGTAVGITVFAGLIFAGLTFLRPGE
ncbi:MAG: hypothetical protein H8E32_03305 [Nitrospinae bacterium]|nr:hypothetical protein [Nitrospinota bacterium]